MYSTLLRFTYLHIYIQSTIHTRGSSPYSNYKICSVQYCPFLSTAIDPYEADTSLGDALITLASIVCSVHLNRPYVFPTVVCQSRRVPSSDPLAYSSPSGLKPTVCTGPKWPLYDSAMRNNGLEQNSNCDHQQHTTHRFHFQSRSRICTV